MIKTLLFILITFTAKFSISQYQVIYEGGYGTTNNLYDDWYERWYFDCGDNVPVATSNFYVANDSNRVQLMTYCSPLGPNFEVRAGIYKTIPGLELYSSFRIIANVSIADTIGTLAYNYLWIDTADQGPFQVYEQFAGNISDSLLVVNNSGGNNTVFLEANLFQADSVKIRFNYVRIEVDTTSLILQSGLSTAPEVAVSSYQSTLSVQTSDNEEPYTIELFNAMGNQIYQATLTGNQTITPGVETGIYFARIHTSVSTQETSVYIE